MIERFVGWWGFMSFVCAGLVGAAAQAALLSPGEAISAPAEPDPAGGTVLASLTVPYASAPNGDVSGSVTTQVISGDLNNPWGGLTFTFQFSNDSGSSYAINRLTAIQFAGFLTDVSYQSATGIAPAFVTRGASGDPVGFSFFPEPLGAGEVTPGGTSALLVIQTDATHYRPGLVSLIDGETAQADSFAPIPEPAALSLLLAGGLLMRRQRAAEKQVRQR